MFEGRDDHAAADAYARARLGIRRSFQILSIFPNLTVFENVRVAVQAQRKRIGRAVRRRPCPRRRSTSEPGPSSMRSASPDRGRPVRQSSAWSEAPPRNRVTLAIDSKLLLLDEPLAGLAEADRVIVAELIKQLAQTHGVLLIEHDIDRVLAISDRISVLHQGRMIADGKPSEVAANPRRDRGLSRRRGGRRRSPRLRRSSASRMPRLRCLLEAEPPVRWLWRQHGAGVRRSHGA